MQELQNRIRGFKIWRIGPLILVALAIIVVWSSWFTVQPEETGVVQRFGAVDRTAGPGLHFKFPYGIETVSLVPTARVLKEEFGFRTIASSGGQRSQYADPSRSRMSPSC